MSQEETAAPVKKVTVIAEKVNFADFSDGSSLAGTN
jgi:hypothetical protein